MYLLYRHPLRGGNYFGQIDEVEEENFLMGSKAFLLNIQPIAKTEISKESMAII
jgi:hypothetical protein